MEKTIKSITEQIEEKDGFSGSFSASIYDDAAEQLRAMFAEDMRCRIVVGTMFDSSHLSRKLKKAHKRGDFYRRQTKWKRILSNIALHQHIELVGRIAKSERTPDGDNWNFIIQSEKP